MGLFNWRKAGAKTSEELPESSVVAEYEAEAMEGDTQAEVASGVCSVQYVPQDSQEVDANIEGLLDAGSLWLPVVPDAQMQFTPDPRDATKSLAVVYILQGSALQLQVFAAPKNKGLWEQVRLDMRTSIAAQGGSSVEVGGPLGKELAAQLPLPDSGLLAPHRFLGVDGPRWLLRISIYGRAATDTQRAAELLEILGQVVVHRGEEPYMPKDLLPLHIQ